MSYYGFNLNPHALRVGVIKNWDSKWYEDEVVQNEENRSYRKDRNMNYNSKDYEIYQVESSGHRIRINSGLLYRKIRLEKMMGKHLYKDVISKVKTLSR